MDRDQQTHRLPENAADLDLLARRAGQPNAAALMTELTRRMGEVREIYSRVIHSARSAPKKPPPTRGFALEAPFSAARSSDYPELLRMLESRYPELYRTAEQTGERGRKSLERFIVAAAAGDGLSALEASPELIGRAAVLFEQSPYLSELLIRSPEDIEALRDLPPVSAPSPELALDFGAQGAWGDVPIDTVPIDPVFEHAATSGAPLHERMAVLRRHYRRSLLRVEARSILEAVPIFETLEATSRLAEQAIRAALRCAAGAEHHSFTVVALGRLGIREFDLASDADLAFFFSPESDVDPEEAAKLGTRRQGGGSSRTVLSSHTSDGALFAVDTRLRPRGREGELVETARFVEDYFRTRAEPWEAITFMKSRAVAGDIARGTTLLTEVQDRIGARFGRGPQAAAELLEMRGRLEATVNAGNYLKVAPGGYYDIDFVLTFLRLRAAQVFYHFLELQLRTTLRRRTRRTNHRGASGDPA